MMAFARRTTVPVACLVLAAIYAWLAARSFQAARLASSLDISSLQRAVALAPGNAAYQDLLCRFLLFDKQAPAAALPRCQRATELNPYHSTYWLDLALAYYNTGAAQAQQQAIRQAVAIDPMTPDVAWTAANFFLALGKLPDAMAQFAVAMRGDVNNVWPALDLCWRASHDANAIQAILPPDPSAYMNFIRLLIANRQGDAAQQVWIAMWRLNRDVDYRQALFYVDALLERHDLARAEQAWEQLAEASPGLNAYRSRDNLLVNGGFEQPLLNSGFDWRYSPQSGSAIARDPDEHHSGAQSLSIAYDGAGGDSGLLQYVPVQPDTQYTISGWTKSEQLEGANGPVLSVWDAYDGRRIAQTRETLGTTSWHRVEAAFRTGPQTTLLLLRMTRDPAATHIKGKLWIDDLTLRPQTAASVSHSPN